jgi:hypothetical protein
MIGLFVTVMMCIFLNVGSERLKHYLDDFHALKY